MKGIPALLCFMLSCYLEIPMFQTSTVVHLPNNSTNSSNQNDVDYLKQRVDHLTALLEKHVRGPTSGNASKVNQMVGVNYIRYGHKSCNFTAAVVYDGFVGKSNHHGSHPGGGVNYLCLPQQPEWPSGVTGAHQSHSYIYGVEYQDNSPLMPSSKHDHDVPCAVCEVSGRSQKMMIPAKLTCPTGWVLEYKGLLMAQAYTYTASDYVCVDSEMEVLTGGHENKDGGLLYVVEAVCGSLPCPPYKDGYEIACVVCTK